MAVASGIYQNRDKIDHWLNPLPPITYGKGQNEVVLYSTSWCGYCAKTRAYFAENQIPYTDLDIEQSEIAHSEFKRLGGVGVPLVVVNNGRPIRGYDPKAIRQALTQQ